MYRTFNIHRFGKGSLVCAVKAKLDTLEQKFFITIVDDDLDDQYLIKEALKETRCRHEVNCVYNGLQLMDLLLKREAYAHDSESPDLILLDLNMPLMDGFTVLKEIRKNPELTSIPVYVLSTSKNDYDAKRAKELGGHQPLLLSQIFRLFWTGVNCPVFCVLFQKIW